MMKPFFVIFLLLFLSGCKKKESPKKMTLTKIETLSFRRSYADHQYLTDKQLDSLYETNPDSEYEIKPSLSTKLNKKKILNVDGLIVENFKENLNKRMIGKKVEISYSYNFQQSNSINVIVEKGNKKIKKHIDFENDNFIGVAYEDLDNDNIEEILILENFYIMNGDNFVLSIFKLNQ